MVRRALLLSGFLLVVGVGGLSAQQGRLQLNTAIERTIGPKESHEYTVTSRGNQALKVVVEQQGADVVVTVLGPDGKPLVAVDSASEEQGTRGSEVAEVRGVIAGEYRIRVVPFERPDAKPAKYTIVLAEVRDLTVDEIANVRAEADITALEEEWERAVDQRDTATLRRIMRKDGIALSNTAAFNRTAEQHVAAFDEAKKQDDELGVTQDHTVTEHTIRVFGNTAVSTGRALITRRAKGQNQSQLSGQFVHVWAKDESGWKMVADHFYPYGRIPREKGTPPTVDPQVLSSYTGAYRVQDSPNIVNVVVEKGTMMIEWTTPSQTFPKMPLVPVTDTTFASPDGQELVFVRAPGGEVRELIFLSDGPAGRATRVK